MSAIPPAPASHEPTDPARTARHLAMLRELAEIGMALARAVGQQALAALEAQAAPATPDAEPTTPASPPRTDPGLAFARIARAVRQCIALEARIAAGPLTPTRGRSARPAPDPRRDFIRRVVGQAAEADGLSPAALRREIEERLDDELESDPGGDLPAEEIIAAICEDLGLGRNLARLPDEVLAILIGAGPAELLATADPDPGPAPGHDKSTPPSRPAGPDPP